LSFVSASEVALSTGKSVFSVRFLGHSIAIYRRLLDVVVFAQISHDH
jgi:hypothetical protein